MKIRNRPSKPLFFFYLVGGAIAVYLLVSSGLALKEGHPDPLIFVTSFYVAAWVFTGSVWNSIEIKRRRKREAEIKRDSDREKESREFFAKLRSKTS